ncbi:MAG: aspartate dehydrogenase [Candidatus Omnitrophota bacterium]
MEKLLKIGIAGCGAIGASLAKAITSDFPDKAELCSLYDIEVARAYQLANKFSNAKLAVLSLDDLINRADLVIEATKAESSFEIAKKSLASGRSIMIMSVGGILEHYKELSVLAAEKKCRVYIPSGAVCGIDALKAAKHSGISKVTLVTKKPAKAFVGVPYVLKRKIRLDNITEDTVLFEGDALTAIRAFPQNINVAATLSLAGVGSAGTFVRIVASAGINTNIHELEIESKAGRIVCRTENTVHPDNPKTSYLAVLSAITVLKDILEPVRIGT